MRRWRVSATAAEIGGFLPNLLGGYPLLGRVDA